MREWRASDLVVAAAAQSRRIALDRARSWHITLQFLGNATSEQFECLMARLGEVRSHRFRCSSARWAASSAPAFSLLMSGDAGAGCARRARGGGDSPVRICGGDAAVSSAHYAGAGQGSRDSEQEQKAAARLAKRGVCADSSLSVSALHGAGVSALREPFGRRRGTVRGRGRFPLSARPA